MTSSQKYFFFRCYHCGEWFYSYHRLKTKKCWKCNRSFQFKNSTKFTKLCTLKEAISIVKTLKKKGENESLIKYINPYENFIKRKKN